MIFMTGLFHVQLCVSTLINVFSECKLNIVRRIIAIELKFISSVNKHCGR
jgi:hypothetical protein